MSELFRQIANALVGKPCQARVAPVGVRLPKLGEADKYVRDVFEPDILGVCDADKIDAKGVRGAPDVIVEVLSPSTADFDQIDKRLAYDKAGVRELWLIDVAGAVLTIYRQNGLRFDPPEIVRATGIVVLQALEGLPLDLRFIDELRRGLE